jgi:hypothetical protein
MCRLNLPKSSIRGVLKMSDVSRNDLLVGLGVIGVLVWQWPNIQARQAEQAGTVAVAKQQMLTQDKMDAEQMVRDASSECAKKRYENGVELLSTLEMDKAVPIQEGKPVVAGAYAKRFNPSKPNPDMYVGRDVVVGDAYGKTAILKFDPELGYATAQEICTTPDRTLMAQILKQRPGIQRPGSASK